jgi:hypothetical protein
VIAVGPNNFQSGSQLIRLRTFGRDGVPQVRGSHIPHSIIAQEQHRSDGIDSVDGNGAPKSPVPSIEAAPALDSAILLTREAPSTTVSHRRNTLNRRHSPSVTSNEPPPIRHANTGEPESSLQELNAAFEKIRKDTDDTQTQYAREEHEFKLMEEDLKREKDKKKQMQKEKDDNTEQLKKKAATTYNEMRNAEKERTKKEKVLSDREAKRSSVQDNIKKWTSDIENMRRKRECFEIEKSGLAKDRDAKLGNLDDENATLRDECSRLEKELKEKKDQFKELEAARKKLPGGEEDEQWKATHIETRNKWERKRRELSEQLNNEIRTAGRLEKQIKNLYDLRAQQQASMQFYSQGNSSGVDFDQPTQNQIKRRSRTGTSLSNAVMASPTSAFAAMDMPFAPSASFTNRSAFAQGPYMDIGAPDGSNISQSMNEAQVNFLTGAAPLSPTATSLVPSGILNMDDDPPSPSSKSRQSPFGQAAGVALDNDPQTPASSTRSFSILSSPRSSSHHLPYGPYTAENSDRLSLKAARGDVGAASPPGDPSGQHSSHRLTNILNSNILSSFHRNRGAKDEGGPPIGSLKQGQSQSFPRQTDETDLAGNRRRISFSSNWFRNSTGPELESAAPAANRGFSARRLNLLGGVNSANNRLYSDRDVSSPRPASIASSDLPRPSTDSSSIWNLPADGATLGRNRLWPTSEGFWSSRNPSRRPSLHGSTSALETTLASADDEILDEEDLLDPQVSPSQVGVIGSRPPPGKASKKSLNPTAPTFMTGMAGLFRPKDKDGDKDKEPGKEKEKSKGKDKDKSKDKSKDKTKANESIIPTVETPQSLSLDDSPSDSRKSRDAFSVHTQTSVSESRESLTLDRTLSNTPSEPNARSTSNVKDQDNIVKKMLRKGSHSKFPPSLRFGAKKGPSSVTNSDKNASADRSSIGDVEDLGDDGPLGRSYDSVTSSPSLGPAKSKDKDSRRKWTRQWSIKKGKKETKESLDLERDKSIDSEPADLDRA